MKKKQDNEDLFLSFLIKEKELAYIQKNHAQAEIEYMAMCFKEKEQNANLFYRTFWDIRDFFMSFVMKFIQYKNKLKIKDISEYDKKEKVIKHLQFKDSVFKTHYFLIRNFQNKTLIDDSGCADISNFEYNVYIRIEFSEIVTQKHFSKSFKKEQEAVEYFNQLLTENKNKKVKKLINDLSNDIDNEYKLLQNRINFLNNQLQA